MSSIQWFEVRYETLPTPDHPGGSETAYLKGLSSDPITAQKEAESSINYLIRQSVSPVGQVKSIASINPVDHDFSASTGQE